MIKQSVTPPEFFGRSHEIERTISYIESGCHLITITGPPGIGKTRLAQVLCSKSIHSSLPASRFVDLSTASTAEEVVTEVAIQLNVSLTSRDKQKDSSELIAQRIRELGRILIVLDNFEQLLETGVETIRKWLQLTDEAVFLVTSRRRLNLHAERCIVLQPLSTSDGIQLFTLRARNILPDLTFTESDHNALKSLVTHLDGLPLAIELAACRIKTMSPESMLLRIETRFAFLNQGPMDSPQRQATLRAAIEWSWDLLSEPEQKALAQLAVFRTAFSLEAAESVVLLPQEFQVLDILESLCSHSLVSNIKANYSTPHRFFLYESIREFAKEHLSDVQRAARKRFANYYVGEGEQQIRDFSMPEGTTLSWFLQNHAHLNAIARDDNEPERAARAALVIAHAQLSRGPFDSLRELLVFTESIHDSLPVDLLVKLHLARGIAETKLGQAKMAKAYLNKAIHTADGAQVSLLAKANLHLGALCGRRGEHKVALANLNQAVEIAKKNGLLQLQCRILAAKGVLFETIGKLEEALKLLGEAQLLASKHHFRWEEIHTRTRLGALYSVLQDKQEEALYHLNWSLDQSGLLKDRKLYEPFLAAGASASLGRLLLNQGKLGEAAQHFKRAKQIYRTMSDRLGEGRVCMGIALLQLDSGETSAADTALKEAEELFYSPDTTTNQVYLHCISMLAALVRGEVIEAQDYFLRTQAMELANINRNMSGMMACVFTFVHVASGEMAQAIEFRNHARASLGWFHRRGQTKWGEGTAMLEVAEAAIVGAEGRHMMPTDNNARRYVLARISWRALNVIRGTSKEFAHDAKIPHEADLLVDHHGRWFQRPPEPVVDLSRKRTLGPLLSLLAHKHATTPDQPMSVDEIFQSVWTGENVLSKSRKNRVYVAMNTLRKLGLDEFIVTRGAGYLLHPSTRVLSVQPDPDKS